MQLFALAFLPLLCYVSLQLYSLCQYPNNFNAISDVLHQKCTRQTTNRFDSICFVKPIKSFVNRSRISEYIANMLMINKYVKIVFYCVESTQHRAYSILRIAYISAHIVNKRVRFKTNRHNGINIQYSMCRCRNGQQKVETMKQRAHSSQLLAIIIITNRIKSALSHSKRITAIKAINIDLKTGFAFNHS